MGYHPKVLCPQLGCTNLMKKGSQMCQRCWFIEQSKNGTGDYKPCPGGSPGCLGRMKKDSKLCLACYQATFKDRHCVDCHKPIYRTSARCMSCENKRRWKLWHQARCQHHWDLDQNNYGVCRKCGAEKQFATPAEQTRILMAGFRSTETVISRLEDREEVEWLREYARSVKG